MRLLAHWTRTSSCFVFALVTTWGCGMSWESGNEQDVSQAEQLASVPNLEKHQHSE